MTEDNQKPRKDERRPDEGNPEFENFQEILRRALFVPKEELERRRTEYEREKKQKRAG